MRQRRSRAGRTREAELERALARREAELNRLAAIVEHAADAIVTKDADGTITEWNRAAERLYGYTRAEAVGRPISLIIPPERAGEDRALLARALAGETIAQHETLRQRKDGSLIDASLTVSPLRDEHGASVGATVVTREITTQKKLERQLVGLIENAPVAIALRGLDGKYQRVNEHMARLFDRSATELIGLDPTHVYPDPNTQERVSIEDAAILRTGEAQTGLYELPQPDGSIRGFQILRFPVFDSAGEVSGFGSFAVDLTDQRQAEREARAAADDLASVLENAPIGMALVAPDGRWLQVNRALCEIVGYDEATLRDLTFQDITHPDDLDTDLGFVRALLAGEITDYRMEKRYIHRSGREVWILLSVTLNRDERGEPRYLIAQIQDIDSMRRAEQARDEAMDRFRVAFERAPIGMAIVGRDATFQRVNQAFCDITGYTAEQLIALAPFALLADDDVEAARESFAAIGAGEDTVTLENRIVHVSGQTRWVQARVTVIRDGAGEPLHAMAQILDITESRAQEAQLKHLVDHDPLSGLLNRRGFETALDGHLARCRRQAPVGALLVLDLDGFKCVNDTLGHTAGDRLLVRCAEALRSRLRESDVVGRLGGDEFAVLLPDAGPVAAEFVAQAITTTVREATTEFTDIRTGPVTCSVGVAVFDTTAASGDEMLTRADMAMYEAKQAGRNRHAVQPVATLA